MSLKGQYAWVKGLLFVKVNFFKVDAKPLAGGYRIDAKRLPAG